MAKLQKRGTRQALGKGLASLLADVESSSDNKGSADIARVFSEIDVENIKANPYQPRTQFEEVALNELADSISVQGIIQPITVRRLAENEYELISGERRLRASKIAGLENIPAYIRTANDQEMVEMALIENIQRQDLNSIEVAHSYQRLIRECSIRQEDVGKRVGKDRTTVTNYLRLLKLPPEIQIGIRDEKIGMSHARTICSIENADLQLSIYHRIISENLSVREVEEIKKKLFQGEDIKKTEKAVTNTVASPELRRVQNDLTSQFGSQIKIKSNNKGKGEIKIPFEDTEDLNRILEILQK